MVRRQMEKLGRAAELRYFGHGEEIWLLRIPEKFQLE